MSRLGASFALAASEETAPKQEWARGRRHRFRYRQWLAVAATRA